MSYPGAAGLVAADPGEVSLLASLFGTVASQAHGSRGDLVGASGDATWTGTAADAFRTKLGKLPGDLANVAQSYGDVAQALSGYETQLGPLQTQFNTILTQIDGLQGSLSTAQGQLTSAQTNLTSASKAPGAKSTSTSVVQAHGAVQAANQAVGQLQGEIAGLERRGRQIVDEFNTARSHARSAVSHAAGYAPQESWWSSTFGAIGHFVAGVFVNIGKSVWALASGKAVAEFIEHPSWSNFGKLMSDIAVTASLVALVVVPFAAPELLEADGALLAGEDVTEDVAGDAVAGATEDGAEDTAESTVGSTEGKSFGDVARGVNTWGNRVATAATGANAVSEGADGHWGAALLDVGLVAAPNVVGGLPKSIGSMRGVGDDVANAFHVGDAPAESAADMVKGLQGAGDSMALYRNLRSFDVSPRIAQMVAFSDGVPEALKNVNLDDGAAVRAAADSANASAASTASKALKIGQPVAYGVDNLIVDPTHDAVNHRLHLVPDDG
jgi:hypothetical protein